MKAFAEFITCDDVKQLLPDYVAGRLSDAEIISIQAYLEAHPACKQEFEVLTRLWSSLGTMTEEKPSPALRENFTLMLAAYQQGMNERSLRSSWLARLRERFNTWLEAWIVPILPKQPVYQLGAALAMLLVGAVSGFWLRGGSQSGSQGAPEHVQEQSIQLSQLRGEVHAMSRLLAVSLMQQQSASERLRGVNISAGIEKPDQELIEALFTTLNTDSNVNVRLAAADALTNFPFEATVRRGIVESLAKQNSPLVQVTLVEVLVKFQEKQSSEALRQMLNDSSLNGTVRTKIQQALQSL